MAAGRAAARRAAAGRAAAGQEVAGQEVAGQVGPELVVITVRELAVGVGPSLFPKVETISR